MTAVSLSGKRQAEIDFLIQTFEIWMYYSSTIETN